jgi:archaellum component FlaC
MTPSKNQPEPLHDRREFHFTQIYSSSEGALRPGLVKFRDGRYEIRAGSAGQALVYFDANSKITFARCDDYPVELHVHFSRTTMFLIFESPEQALAFTQHLGMSERNADPGRKSIQLLNYTAYKFNGSALPIRQLLMAYDQIRDLRAFIEESKERVPGRPLHNASHSSHVSVNDLPDTRQPDRIQDLEVELSRLQAEATRQQEALQSNARANRALREELSKSEHEQNRLRGNRDEARKALESWKSEAHRLQEEIGRLKNMTHRMQANENPLKSQVETLKASVETLRKEVAEKTATIEALDRKRLASDRLATHNQSLLDEVNEEHNTQKTVAADMERRYKELEASKDILQERYTEAFDTVRRLDIELEAKKNEVKDKDRALNEAGRKYGTTELELRNLRQQIDTQYQPVVENLRNESGAKSAEIDRLQAENEKLLGMQQATENDNTNLQSELDRARSDLTKQRRETARQTQNHAKLLDDMAEKEDQIARLSNGLPLSTSTAPNNATIEAAVQQARTQWDAEAKKKQLDGFEAYRSSKEKRLQKVIDALGDDTPLMKRKIMIEIYQQEIEEIDNHIKRVKEGQPVVESIENWYDGAADPLADVRQ